jgi:hypothetical protein
MRVNAYNVLYRAVEEGVAIGWIHAHKHTSRPTSQTIEDTIVNEVLNAISEVFDFGADLSDGS